VLTVLVMLWAVMEVEGVAEMVVEEEVVEEVDAEEEVKGRWVEDSASGLLKGGRDGT
jgi:hypothetical protein